MSTTNGHLEQSIKLPTFTSVSDQPQRPTSHAESSNASSSRSRAHRSSISIRSDHDDASDTRDTSKERPITHNETSLSLRRAGGQDNGTIRRSKRASGGFLLDTSPTSSRLSRSLLSQIRPKGKQKEEEQGTLNPQKWLQLDGQDSRSSTRASPLSSELRSSPPAATIPHDAHTAHHSLRQHRPVSSSQSYASGSSKPTASSYGFDTDPSQIVEMALRLNEGRRLQASANRYVSGASESRRIVSTATSTFQRESPPEGPAGFNTARPSTVARAPNLGPITPQKRRPAFDTNLLESTPVEPDGWSPEQTGNDVDQETLISRATQNRVARAKAYFELAYEHRRLLSHLPPLRTPDPQRDARRTTDDSKVYNPLQYVRNRKLRFRERSALNTEAEGWHDVLKVRAWVDAVINSHAATKHDPLECIRLPPLDLLEKEPSDPDNESDTEARPSTQKERPRRPKSDWVTHPGDLIADAFWTEQGLNKQKLYNSNNEPIFPPGTKFLFSGWRNRPPIKVPDQLKSASSPEISPTFDRKRSVPAAPDLPVFESAQKDHSWGKAKNKFRRAVEKRSRNTKEKAHEIFDTSSESSGTDEGRKKHIRGRKRVTKRQDKLTLPDGDPFAPPVRSAAVQQMPDSDSDEDPSVQAQKDPNDHARILKHLRRASTTMSAGDESEGHKRSKRRNFLHTFKFDADPDQTRESFDYDSTAPPTPAVNGFPSIAINLSPPESRSSSPNKHRYKGSFLENVKDKLPGQKERINQKDFAAGSNSTGSQDRSPHSRAPIKPHAHSRGTSPITTSRGTSPFTRSHGQLSVDEEANSANEHRISTISKLSNRTSDLGSQRSHRVRGMFKGGRIAELVGHEVNRVGDFIWKRDPPRRSDIMAEGSASGYESDSDDAHDDEEIRQGKNRAGQSSLLVPSSPGGAKSATPPTPVLKPSLRETPQYHISGLPSFTSPFQRDRDEQDRKAVVQSPGGTPQVADAPGEDPDPVSTGAAARRAAGRSPRFDRLAPPKLDIQAATPDSRRNSYGFGTALKPDLERTRSASALFNDAINGEAMLPSESRQSSVSGLGISRFQAQSNTDLNRVMSNRSEVSKNVSIHDLLRTRGLLVAVAVKATNISTYCESIPRPQSSFLFSAFETSGASGSEINKYLPARRREEHGIAANQLINHLSHKSNSFNEQLNNFTQSTAANLQREVQILEDKTDSSLFPRLQRLSDTAGQLAQKLTTTSTLAVKGVNDEVSEAMRLRRRGPHRLGRWLGYKLIEISVVSILWLIWFVVTICRFGIGTVRFVKNLVAWMLFLR